MPNLTGVRFRLFPALRRFCRRHDLPLALGGLAVGVVVLLLFSRDTADHPTRESAAQHLAGQLVNGQPPKLSEAELRVLRQRDEDVGREWVTEQTFSTTKVHHLDRPGEIPLRVGYSDGYFTVSDLRHRDVDFDRDQIDVLRRTHSVAAGPPRQIMVSTCCEGNDARVTLVLRRAAPTRVPSKWTEITDLDFDLPAGRLVFTSTGEVSDLVKLPPGRYRMRVVGTGAIELEQDRERFRIELWPRRANAPMTILRTSHRR